MTGTMGTRALLVVLTVGVSCTHQCTSDQDCPLPCPSHEVGHCNFKGQCECQLDCMHTPPPRCVLPCPLGLVGKCDNDGYCRCHTEMVGRGLRRDAKCIICEIVMIALDDILQKNSTAKDIDAALDVVCSLMPDTINKECVDFVASYSAQVIRLLVNDLDPDKICRDIKAC